MSAMKEVLTNLQEEVNAKLVELGAPRETVFRLEEEFADRGEYASGEFEEEFAAKMVRYAVSIRILSVETGYTTERLWNIWEETMSNFLNGDGCYSTLEEEWESFKDAAREKDW